MRSEITCLCEGKQHFICSLDMQAYPPSILSSACSIVCEQGAGGCKVPKSVLECVAVDLQTAVPD